MHTDAVDITLWADTPQRSVVLQAADAVPGIAQDAEAERGDASLEGLPDYRVVILGAGRGLRGHMPTAVMQAGANRCVLDWLLAAFGALHRAEVRFVGGYMADAIRSRYTQLHVDYNPAWESTGPVHSLSLTPLASGLATFVSYADVVFRPEVIARMQAQTADVVLGVDSRWRHRYDARSRSEQDAAEKILCRDGQIAGEVADIGKHIVTDEAAAEFCGIVRLSGRTARRLENVIRSGLFKPTDGLPEVLRFLLRHDVICAVVDLNGEWAELNAPQDLARFVLGTKAESLARLRPLLRSGRIGESVSFTLAEWRSAPAAWTERIVQVFGSTDLIVRSSALSEDSWQASCAGAYRSILDVCSTDAAALTRAIDDVFASYGEPHADNQVLVQAMLRDVTMSGVVMTRTPATGGPHLVINYDNTTARTDTVTAGNSNTVRTMFVHRSALLRPGLPRELYRLMAVVQEIEQLVGHDVLDIEFAFTRDGTAHILQVRPIAIGHLDQPVDDERIAESLKEAVRYFRELQRPRPHLLGRSTQLSVMSDWNPAEIIGTKPSRLAFSLYRHLITDEVWARQRAEYGYRDVRPCNLLVDILGHPYIDVRATFNSFIPAALPDALAGRLLEHSLDHLTRHPALHDKVEFDVLFTCMAFDFDRRVERLRQAGFRGTEIDQLRAALVDVTRGGMARYERDWAVLAASQERFARIQAAHLPPLERAYLLLEEARLHSIPAFAHLARGAFVAVSLLRSLCAVGITTEQQKDRFLASIHTVSSDMQTDARAVAGGTLSWEAFVERYGHLRPGTYDITSPRYGSAPEEYLRPAVEAAARCNDAGKTESSDHPWDATTRAAVARALRNVGLDADVGRFKRFLRRAIEGREYSKFVFTRNLSAALEALAEFGSAHFVGREEFAHIRIHDLLALRGPIAEPVACRLQRLAAEGREEYSITQAICLPGQVRSEADLVCFEQLRASPNFITQKKVCAQVICLSSRTSPDVDLAGKIVVTPNADPGFDWIFARRIAGLLTMYGGTNSHMAIRAAEFQLPAATGIGELLYEQVSRAERVELDCASRLIRPVK